MSGAKPEESTVRPLPTKRLFATAIVLVVTLVAQCAYTANTDSVSWDESQHLYSGWLSWKHADFGFNPEVSPLVKVWCAIPLLGRHTVQPPFIGGEFKKEGFVLGQRFLASNGIDRTLIPARLMAALLEAMGRSVQAKAAYQNALQAPELDPVFQEDLLIALQGKSNR